MVSRNFAHQTLPSFFPTIGGTIPNENIPRDLLETVTTILMDNGISPDDLAAIASGSQRQNNRGLGPQNVHSNRNFLPAAGARQNWRARTGNQTPGPSGFQRRQNGGANAFGSRESLDSEVGSHQNERNGGNGNGNTNNWRNRGQEGRQNSWQRQGNDGNRERRNVGPGFKYLEELCEKDPEEILISISANKGFSIRLEQELTGDYIFILLKLFAKMCMTSFTACKVEVVKQFCTEKFIDQVKKYIATLPAHDNRDKKVLNRHFWGSPDEFWNNLCVTCGSVIELIPSNAVDVLPKLIITAALSIQNIETVHKVAASDKTKQNLEKLQEKIALCIEEIERKQNDAPAGQEFVEEIEPPDDFRELTVYPTSAEVLSEDRSFVRMNKVEGRYRDIEEYLDIQFRLLREDFVGPLREGIGEYLKQKRGSSDRKKIHSVKVHPRIRFLATQNVKDQVGVRLQFELDARKLTKNFGRLENSKRFMFGALVCFTKDDFQSLIFGKIIDRDPKLLEKGMIVVSFDNDENIDYDVEYIMVECSVYFEPYYHVLKALQAMDVQNFPMEHYIVNVDPEIRIPRYLSPESNFKIDKFRVGLFHAFSWPNAKALQLNDTQYEAFKAGLTKEFCIIQGPPGKMILFY